MDISVVIPLFLSLIHIFIRSGKTAFFLFILFHFFVYEILPHSQPTELKWLSLKPVSYTHLLIPRSRAYTAAILKKNRLRPGTNVLGTLSAGFPLPSYVPDDMRSENPHPVPYKSIKQYDKDRCSIFVLRFLFEPLVGFEPTTPRLQITCSGPVSYTHL